MNAVDDTVEVDLAVDNDVIIKAACYGLTAAFWPEAGSACQLGVLGAARYVVAKRLARMQLVGDNVKAQRAVEALLATARALEPTNAPDREILLISDRENSPPLTSMSR